MDHFERTRVSRLRLSGTFLWKPPLATVKTHLLPDQSINLLSELNVILIVFAVIFSLLQLPFTELIEARAPDKTENVFMFGVS